MKKKADIQQTTTISLIVLVVVIVVLLALNKPLIAWFRGAGEEQVCVTSTFWHALSKKGGFALTDIKCPMKSITLVMRESDVEESAETEEYIEIDKRPRNTGQLAEWYGMSSSVAEKYFSEKENYIEYNLDKEIADQMKSCWNRLGAGELDLFSDWFLDFGYEKGTTKHWVDYAKLWNLEWKTTPTVCVKCAHITFDSKVRDYVKTYISETGTVTSLTDWTTKHPVKVFGETTPKSYYEYMRDDVYESDFFIDKVNPKFIYNVDEDYAVIFARSNVYALAELGRDIWDIWPGYSEEDHVAPLDAIFIMPYADTGSECDDYAG